MRTLGTLAAILVVPACASFNWATQPTPNFWVDTGEQNIATLLKLNKIAEEIKGKQITPTLLAQLENDMMSHYASTMTCSMMVGSNMAKRLTNVPVKDCFADLAQVWAKTRVLDYSFTNIAIDPKSGGKTVLEHMTLEADGVTDAMQHVPGTSMSAHMNYRYHFNDQGLIDKMDQDFDTGLLEDMQSKVRRFEGEGSSSRAISLMDVLDAGSWPVVGQNNLATVLKLSEVARELQGKHITPAAMAKLSEDTMAFFAPSISCSVMQGSSKAMHFSNVPAKECLTGFAGKVANTKLLEYKMDRVAMDPNRGGKTILTYEPFMSVGVTSAGEEVPGTKASSIMTFRYDFDDEGKITRYDQEMDSGILETMQKQVMIYEKKGGQIDLDSEEPSEMILQLSAVTFFCGASLALVIGFFSGAFLVQRMNRYRRAPSLLSEPY